MSDITGSFEGGLNLSAKIKTRAATSNQNFENSLDEKNVKNNKKRTKSMKFEEKNCKICIFWKIDFSHFLGSY